MNSIVKRIERLEESLGKTRVNESFKSSALRQFALELKKTLYKGNLRYIDNGFSNINFSQLKEEDVIFVTPEQAAKYVAPEYIVCWGVRTKKQVKYKFPSYSSRSGRQTDNSLYVTPGMIGMTCGRKFVKLSNGKFTTLDSNYELPANGSLSYLKLKTEIADYAIVISADIIQSSAAAKTAMRITRNTAQGGSLALALNNGLNVAFQNIRKYKEQIKQNKLNAGTKEIIGRVNEALASLKSRINSKSNLGELVSFKMDTDYGDRAREVAQMDKLSIEKLTKLVDSFNSLTSKASNYLYYVKNWGLDHYNTTDKLERLDTELSSLGY